MKPILTLLILLFLNSLLIAQDSGNLLSATDKRKYKEIPMHKITGACGITRENGKYGILYDGEPAVPAIYDNITEDRRGCYKVRKNNKQGIISISGSFRKGNNCISSFKIQQNDDPIYVCFYFMIPCVYDRIEEQSNGTFRITRNNNVGITGSTGSVRIPCAYDRIEEQSNGTYRITRNNNVGITGSTGSIRIPCVYDRIEEQPNGTYRITQNSKVGIAGSTGSIRIPCAYDRIEEQSNGTYRITQNSKIGIAGSTGSIRIPCVYDRIEEQSNGTYRITQNSKIGIAGSTGSIRIPCVYDRIEEQSNGTYRITQNGKIGIAGSTGSIRIPCVYDRIEEQPNGTYRAIKGNTVQMLSSLGKEISGTSRYKVVYSAPQHNPALNREANTIFKRYDEVIRLKNADYLVKRDNKYGIITQEGKSLVSCKYDHIKELNQELKQTVKLEKEVEMMVLNDAGQRGKTFYTIQKGDKYGLINGEGKTVLDCIYDRINLDDQNNIVIVKDNIRKNLKLNNL